MPTLAIKDLQRHTAALEPEISLAIERVVKSGWYVLGGEVAAFEREFSGYCGVRFCAAVANGTDALELGLRALDVCPGDAVATVANAGNYSSTAIRAVGASPIYIDVDRDSRLMDLDLLERELDARPIRAVMITHLYGLLHDLVRVREIAMRRGIALIEDCAQAHGARRADCRAGSVGDLAAFSFYPTKNLGALGDGGAVVTSDPEINARLRQLRQYGWARKYAVMRSGGRNSRLDEIQAAVLRVKLPHLEGWNARRRQIARHYFECIKHPRVTCPEAREEDYVAHLFVVLCDDPAALSVHLARHDIASDVHYPIPDHRQCNAAQIPVSLPATEWLAAHVLTLPCFPELSDAEVSRVVDVVNRWES